MCTRQKKKKTKEVITVQMNEKGKSLTQNESIVGANTWASSV
jgi:hypothetical protein